MDASTMLEALMARINADSPSKTPPPLPPERGDGTPRDMEPRLAKLEAQMEAVRAELARLSGLPVELARLDERVKHLPSKGFVITATTTTIGLISAMVLFADKLRALILG